MFVISLDQARAITAELGLTPSYENVRRVVRAYDIVHRDYVHHWLATEKMQVYKVNSQTSDNTYIVGVNGSLPVCSCPDDARVCKHGIAVMLSEQTKADVAQCALMEAYEADRFACDGHELY